MLVKIRNNDEVINEYVIRFMSPLYHDPISLFDGILSWSSYFHAYVVYDTSLDKFKKICREHQIKYEVLFVN